MLEAPKEKDGNTLAVVSEEWLKTQKGIVRESSYIKYRNCVRHYIIPEIGEENLSSINIDCLEKFTVKLSTSGGRKHSGLSPKTVSDTLSILRQILAFSMRRSMEIDYSAFQFRWRSNNKKITVLSNAEQKKLQEYLLSHPNRKNMGIFLTLMTGLRIGELCALKWKDISFEEKCIYVRHTMQRIQTDSNEPGKPRTKIVITSPKSACSLRIIPLSEGMIRLLRASQEDGYFLTGSEEHYTEPRVMEAYFKKILDRNQIRQVNFHVLRHTFATRCVELGFDMKSLSEILGHSNVNITMNRYVHPSMNLKRQQMEKLTELI